MLNGGSSSGTSGTSRCLQTVLSGPWLRLGVDDLVDRLPPSLLASSDGVVFGSHGQIAMGTYFREMEAAWQAGAATMAKAGARIVHDAVFLGGVTSQQRLRAQLNGVRTLWVGVRCGCGNGCRREVARGDRSLGMAAAQAEVVHESVVHDTEVDTTNAGSLDCARHIAARIGADDRRRRR